MLQFLDMKRMQKQTYAKNSHKQRLTDPPPLHLKIAKLAFSSQEMRNILKRMQK